MLYPVIKGFVRCVCKLVFLTKFVHAERIPEEGAVILAANHTSLWDAPVLVSGVKRSMRTMAKKELFENKLLASLLSMAGAFPVDRQKSDIGAIKTALKTLKDGEVFTIFPSGTRVKSEDDAAAKAGVALIASRSGAPVIPVAIRGGYKPFHRVTVTFGEPICIDTAEGKKPSGEELQAFADEIMKQIESLGV